MTACKIHQDQQISLICIELKCQKSNRLGCSICFQQEDQHLGHENQFLYNIKQKFEQIFEENNLSLQKPHQEQVFQNLQDNFQDHKEKSAKDLSQLKNSLKIIDQLIVDLKLLKSQCNDKISDISQNITQQLNKIDPQNIQKLSQILKNKQNDSYQNIEQIEDKNSQDQLIQIYQNLKKQENFNNSSNHNQLHKYYPQLNEFGYKNSAFIEGKVIQDSIKLVKKTQEQLQSIGQNRVEKLQYEIQSQYCQLSIQTIQKLSNSFICTVSKDYFQVWDLQKREVSQAIRQDNSGCLLKFNEDTLLSACMENIVIFPLKSIEKNGKFIPEIDQQGQQQIVGHEEMVYSLASVDESRFLSGGFDHTIRLWNFFTKRCISVFKGHEGRIFYNNIMAQNEDDFISIDDMGVIKFWTTSSEECQETREIEPPENEQFQKMSLEDEEDNDTQCLILKMTEDIFLTTYNNTVQIWDANTKQQTINKNFALHDTMINEIKRLKGNIFLSVSEDFSAKAWKISDNYQDIKLVETFQDSFEIFSSSKIQEKYIVTGNKDGKVSLWSCGVL